ncbi:MAG: acetylesterase [Lachnospiraceae bacterium]|nr:acetylesterase [Lachnospiraceae bacterium]
MALYHINFFSQCLGGQTELYAVIPNDVPAFALENNPQFQRPTKVLVLLHGYSGNAADWVTGSRIREIAQDNNLAVLMPNGRNSFYIDKESTGEKYASYVGSELLSYAAKAFGLDVSPENCIIGGLSMGGFGAIHTGLMFDSYSKVIGLSSALIVNQLAVMEDNPMANKAYYENTFGDLSVAAMTDHNPEVLVLKRKKAGRKMPDIYMACGSEDFLFEANNELDAFLTEQGVAHEYHVSPGIHNWTFWNEYLEPAVKWALSE